EISGARRVIRRLWDKKLYFVPSSGRANPTCEQRCHASASRVVKEAFHSPAVVKFIVYVWRPARAMQKETDSMRASVSTISRVVSDKRYQIQSGDKTLPANSK